MIELKTEEKLTILSCKFPKIEQASLLELLIACNGDTQKTVDLISFQFPIDNPEVVYCDINKAGLNEVNDGYLDDNGADDTVDTSFSNDANVVKTQLSRERKINSGNTIIKEEEEEDDDDDDDDEELNVEFETIPITETKVEPITSLKRELSQSPPISPSLQSKIAKSTTSPFYKPKVGSKPKLQPTPRTITLYTKEEIEASIPQARVIPNFLPSDLSNTVLKELLSKTSIFKHNEFYIAGTKCKSSHKTAIFVDELHKDKQYDNEFYQTGTTKRQFSYSTNLKLIRYMIENEVNGILDANSPAKFKYQVQKNWEAMLCVANYFEDNKKHLDWHSDKLTNIGPLPLICSLTLGATRIFRLKKIYKLSSLKKSNDNTIYNIPLSHNMLLIMLPGCQEEYKHCVPTLSNSLFQENKISGDKRFNLTFRMFHLKITSNNPSCPVCKKSMILRRMYKNYKTRGYYFWMCQSTYLGMACKGFYYGKFDEINNPKDNRIFTTKLNEATIWISDDDIEAKEYKEDSNKQLFDIKMGIREEITE